MELFEAITKRHSYRGGFQDKAIPEKDLRKIVQAGIQAPSGCNQQTTSFIIVDDRAIIAQIASIMDMQVVREARALIVCAVDHREVYKHNSFGVEDCAAAVQNMLLAITALGYATVWLDGVLRDDNRAGHIGQLLGVPAERQVRIILPLGVPTENIEQKPRLPFAKRAWFNHWQQK